MNTYTVKVGHMFGVRSIATSAKTREEAIERACNLEQCPRSAIVSVDGPPDIIAGAKAYHTLQMAPRGRHVVSFHDGVKTHPDGSPFYDIRIFGRKRDAERFERELKAMGYTEAR